MSASSGWLRVVARRLCGYRTTDEWRAKAQRLSLERRQTIALREADVAAARELLALIECPTPADLQRAEEESERGEEQEEEDESSEVSLVAIDPTSAPTPPAPTTAAAPPPDSPQSAPIPIPIPPTPVERFNALLDADITVERVQAGRYDPSTDPITSALFTALSDSAQTRTVSWDSETCEIFAEFRLFDTRLHLAAPMLALEQRVREQYATTAEEKARDGRQEWEEWTDHVIALAVAECERYGVRVFDASSGERSEFNLTRDEHFDRVTTLIEQLGLQKSIGPWPQHDVSHCYVCEGSDST